MVRTSTKGIFQSDIIIRTALMAALDDIRANPFLLDFVFASLLEDELTNQEYGAKELEEARNWFLKTDIPIAMSTRFDQVTSPMIALSLEDSSEAATTLGDVHSTPTEEVEATEVLVSRPVVPEFTPRSYDLNTGIVTLPTTVSTDNVFPGMLLFDRKANQAYRIEEVLGPQSLQIASGVKANFTKAVIAPTTSFAIAHLESVEERESYRLDLYVSGDASHILYLYAIVKFALYRYKQDLFEARGFERSSINVTGLRFFKKEGGEVFYSRTFMLNGYVRQYWPKQITQKIDGLIYEFKLADLPASPDAVAPQVDGQGWEMGPDDFDGIGKP
jgi:hypothetical protein